MINILRQWKNALHREQGFGLVELLATITVFSMIMIAVGIIFADITRLQRRGFGAQVVQENTMFVLETMAREIRVSTLCSDITCATEGSPSYDCSTGFTSDLFIKHPVNGIIQYTIDQSRIVRASAAESWATYISSPDIAFTRFNLCIMGGSTTDDKQSRVAILAQVKSVPTTAPNVFTLDIQTTVSARDILAELSN